MLDVILRYCKAWLKYCWLFRLYDTLPRLMYASAAYASKVSPGYAGLADGSTNLFEQDSRHAAFCVSCLHRPSKVIRRWRQQPSRFNVVGRMQPRLRRLLTRAASAAPGRITLLRVNLC